MCTFTVAPVPYGVTVWKQTSLVWIHIVTLMLLVEIFYDCQQVGYRHKLTTKKLHQNISRGFYITSKKLPLPPVSPSLFSPFVGVSWVDVCFGKGIDLQCMPDTQFAFPVVNRLLPLWSHETRSLPASWAAQLPPQATMLSRLLNGPSVSAHITTHMPAHKHTHTRACTICMQACSWRHVCTY